MEFREFGTLGFKVSRLSFGASALGGVFRPVDEVDAIRAVHAALDAGINYIDVAPAYGATRSGEPPNSDEPLRARFELRRAKLYSFSVEE